MSIALGSLNNKSSITGTEKIPVSGSGNPSITPNLLKTFLDGWNATGATTITTPTITGNWTLVGNQTISGNTSFLKWDRTAATSTAKVIEIDCLQGSTYGKFYHTFDDGVLNPSGQRDAVYMIGYNNTPGGGKVNAAEAEMHISFESDYPGISSHDFEYHLQSTAIDGTVSRHFSTNIRKADGYSTSFWTTNSVEWRATTAGGSYFSLNPNGTVAATGTAAKLSIVNSNGNTFNIVPNSTTDGIVVFDNPNTTSPEIRASATVNGSNLFTIQNASGGNAAQSVLKLIPSSGGNGGQLGMYGSAVTAVNNRSLMYLYNINNKPILVYNNLGIGDDPDNANVTASLTVRGSTQAATELVRFNNGSTNRFLMLNTGVTTINGNTFIGGTTTPSATLQVGQGVLTSSWIPAFRSDPGAHTGMTASTTFVSNDFQGSTQTWGSGTIAIQPFTRFRANTLAGTSGTNTATIAATVQVDPTTVGTNAAITNNFTIYHTGKEGFDATLTAGGTTGAQTINKPTGSVNFAASAQTLVVTNSLVTTSSLIFLTINTDDATAKSAIISAQSAGSFTIKLNVAATAETKVGFLVIN